MSTPPNSPASKLSPDTPVLIVDDNPQYTAILKKILETSFGLTNLTSLESTAAAYEAIRNEPNRYRLLFVDYRFPSGDTGGELLLRLKRENLLEGKVAMLITSEPTVENLKQASSAGAIGVIAKPFDRQKLAYQLDQAARALLVDELDSF